MSSPLHVPTDATRQTVRDLYSCGITQERIAQRLKISVNTLTKYYEQELDNEMENMIAALSKNLYQDALKGCKADREFWLRTRGRYCNYRDPEEKKKSTAEAILERIMERREITI